MNPFGGRAPGAAFDLVDGRRFVFLPYSMPASLFANDPAVLGAVSDAVIPDSLETEVRRIYARSPLYARRFPLHAAPLEWACFQEIPTLAKRTS